MVLECDGTEICDDDILEYFGSDKEVFVILNENEVWKKAALVEPGADESVAIGNWTWHFNLFDTITFIWLLIYDRNIHPVFNTAGTN